MNVLFISLGCDKNLVDSEVMLGLINQRGYQITDDETQADIIIINTCCFINDAKEESINTILEMAQQKQTGRLKALIVTGCMAERYREEILTEIPEVDALLGTNAYDEITQVIDEALAGEETVVMRDLDSLPQTDVRRMVTTGGHYAYLKIAEGCDKHCTYCIIPKLRGHYRSFPMERLISEAQDLADQGTKELILVAQETTVYGQDIYGRKALPELLHKLCRIDGLKFIRILYCYPEEINAELIETMKDEPKICHYLDLPIQHANDEILKRMGRRTSKADLFQIIGELRAAMPDICLRTTLITGFPGETEAQHQELLEFVREVRFDRLGVFTYSQEEDTPAAAWPDQIDEETKKRRQGEIMEVQQEIAFARAEEMIGRELAVMIEGQVADENAYIGRTYRDAPGVDGYIFIETGEVLMTGDVITARVTGADEYDLIGEMINEFTE